MIKLIIVAISLALTAAHAEPIAAPKKAPAPKAKDTKSAPVQKAPGAELNAVAAAIQATYNKTKTAHFSFEQSYKHPFLTNNNETSKGEAFFKAKNMLWRYFEPADRKKEFYVKGNTLIYLLVNDKIAYKNECFDSYTLPASITFLWGEGDLKKSFTFEPFTGNENPKLSWLTLVPKEKDAPVKNIALGVDKKQSQVVESIVSDKNGGINHFKFSNFVINKPIDDGIFNFIAPKDVTVQNMPNVTCPSPPPPAPPPAKPQAPVAAPKKSGKK